MSSFVSLTSYADRATMPTVDSSSQAAVRTGVLRAVAQGHQEGADLSALWTPKSGKRQGQPSKADYIVKACIKLMQDAGLDENDVTFDVRTDGTHESVVCYNTVLLSEYIAESSEQQ